MKKQKALLLVLSLGCITTLVGHSSWILDYSYTPTQVTNKIQAIPVAYIVGKEDIKYTTIEKALDDAQSGDIVCVIPPVLDNYHSVSNKVSVDKVEYEISRNCEIKAGVTLVLPTDSKTFSTVTDSNTLTNYLNSMSNDDRNRGGNYALEAKSNEKNYLRVTIKIKERVTLENNGNLIISGYLGGGNNSSGMIGQTTHSYSQIILKNGSKIVQNNQNANLYCYGYILEETNNNDSIVDIKNGNLYLPLIIYDYRGFSFSYALTNGALKDEHCSPFNQLSVKNIEANVSLSYKSKTYGVSNLYLKYDSMNVEKSFNNVIGLVGNDGSFFIQFNNESYSSLYTRIDKNTNILSLDFYGGCILNNIDLVLQATSTMKINLSTIDSFLPITYRHNVSLNCANAQETATYDFTKQRIKLLPESMLKINKNCNVSTLDFAIYTTFYDGSLGNGNNISNAYNGAKYPLKKGATMIVDFDSTLNSTSIGGQIYCDNADNISFNSNIVVSKEAWNFKSGSGLTPWITDDYLEIREKLNVSPIAYLEKKKIFCGINTFKSNNNNLPQIEVRINNGESIVDVDTYQKVIFMDEISDYTIDFIKNVYKVLKGETLFTKNELITYSDSNSVLCAINSNIGISNNNNGVNEFNAQSVTVSCSTPLIDGNVPLYPGSTIQLKADVVDIEKIYDKNIFWTSSDNTKATIDTNGKVTGISLGEVTFTATCDGVSGSFTTAVINSEEIIPITTITISDGKGNSKTLDTTTASNLSVKLNETSQYKNNTNVTFTLLLNDGAKWSSIEWYFKPSQKGRQYINDKTLDTETILNTESVTVHVVSGTGKDDDTFTLTCSVVDLSNGKTYKISLTLYHKADFCIIEGTKIMLSDGKEKNIEDLTFKDELMIYNHFDDKLDNAKMFFNYHADENNIVTAKILTLIFNDETSIRVHVDHGFFDINLGKYVYINLNNYENYIGHEFIKIDSYKKISKILLIHAKVKEETVRVYSPVSVMHLNVIANGLLSITGEIEGWFNFFEYDKLKYNKEKMKNDIKKYGLYEYSDFKEYMRKEIFDMLPIPYLKISVGKGLTTKEKIISVMKEYLSDK